MSKMNEFEARMKIGEAIMDVLADLTVDGDDTYTEEQILEVEDAMTGVADLILQVLQLQVRDVEEDGTIVCGIALQELAEETTA
jgi:hypothetical protein